ncbi:unnamed protein product [Dovyalis caffra]|uniref:Uncharacterized protein n=1 Tax=Dovyalis caffra TaxID=77055 RepID=A0AAV1R119_9ROSI|nr:unnamed protein product [Dovyalis caffra]
MATSRNDEDYPLLYAAQLASASTLPTGCSGAIDIVNVSFVSLNAVALLCGNNKLRFGVEKVVGMERIASPGFGLVL